MHGSRSTRLTRFMASLSKAFGRPVQPTKQASSRVMSLSKSTASPRSPPASSRAKCSRTEEERIFCSWSGRKAMRAIEPFIPIRTNQRASGDEMRPSRSEAAASLHSRLSMQGLQLHLWPALSNAATEHLEGPCKETVAPTQSLRRRSGRRNARHHGWGTLKSVGVLSASLMVCCGIFSLPRPIVSAVNPARPPSCIVSTAELGTMTMVEFCFRPS